MVTGHQKHGAGRNQGPVLREAPFMMRLGIIVAIVGWLTLQGTSAEELFDVESANQRFNTGLTLYFQENYTEAISEFREAIQINPENAKAFYFIGYALYKSGEFEEASRAFDMSYQLESKYSPIPLNR